MNKILLLISLSIIFSFSCSEENYYGVYVVKYSHFTDTLIIYPGSTFYHSVFDNKKNIISFSQKSTYRRFGDLWTFDEFKRDSLSTQKSWDTEFHKDLFGFRIVLPYDVLSNKNYEKVE